MSNHTRRACITALAALSQVLLASACAPADEENQRDEQIGVVQQSAVPKNDIGVIPDADTNCPGDEVTFKLDNEDSDVNNRHDGWNGSWESTNNTLLRFCRVASKDFRPLDTMSRRRSDYAVLKLGEKCPAGAHTFSRYFDDEDNNNADEFTGDVAPSVSDHNTRLVFCVFTGDNKTTTMSALPNIGFPYGILATPEFAFGRTPGWIRTDDEDDDNNNSWSGDSAGTAMIEVGPNTTMHLWAAP